MIYLFYGSNSFARKQAITALVARVPGDVADFNVAVLHGRNSSLEDVRSACAAYPMLHEYRVVVVHELLKQQRSTHSRDTLRVLLQTLPATTELILNEDDPPDQRLAYIKDLQKLAKNGAAHIQSFEPLEGHALLQWINSHVQQWSVRIEPQAAQLLVDYIGSDSWNLHHELMKLATYVGEHGTITAAQIELLITDQAETNLFAFIDALCSRQGAQATRLFHELVTANTAPLYILSMMARQVRLMIYAQQAGRVAPQQLAQIMGQKPFVARKAAEQSRAFRPDELKAFHEILVQIDHGIKTGTIDALAALETTVATFGYQTSSQRLT